MISKSFYRLTKHFLKLKIGWGILFYDHFNHFVDDFSSNPTKLLLRIWNLINVVSLAMIINGLIMFSHKNISIISLFLLLLLLVIPKRSDQEPEQHIISVVITALAIIIILLIAVILFIVSKNKRTRTAAVLNGLQHTPYSDGLGIDKRLNSNFKVSIDDNESIDKSSLYHEPFNVNMYTSAASGCTLNDMQQRLHVTRDYTGESFDLAHFFSSSWFSQSRERNRVGLK